MDYSYLTQKFNEARNWLIFPEDEDESLKQALWIYRLMTQDKHLIVSEIENEGIRDLCKQIDSFFNQVDNSVYRENRLSRCIQDLSYDDKKKLAFCIDDLSGYICSLRR